MRFTALEAAQLLHRDLRFFIGFRTDRKRDQYLIRMQPRVRIAEVIYLQILYGLDDRGRDQIHLLIDPAESLQCVQQKRSGCAEQRCGLAGYDPAVGKYHRSRGSAGLSRLLVRRRDNGPLVESNTGLLHDHLYLHDLFGLRIALKSLTESAVVTPDDLIVRRGAYDVIVENAVSCHVNAHIGGRLIRRFAENGLEHRVQNREDLNVAVVVYRGLSVRFEMEGVDHIDVVQIGCCRFVRQINGML